MRLMIAAYMGYSDFVFRGLSDPKDRDWAGKIRDGFLDPVPDYTNDHNSIQGVINSFDLDQLERYRNHLVKVCGTYEYSVAILRASTIQKAEAVYLTIKC